MSEPDWKTILWKFIWHVGDIEGVTYAENRYRDFGHGGDPSNEFTDEEWKALNQLAYPDDDE